MWCRPGALFKVLGWSSAGQVKGSSKVPEQVHWSGALHLSGCAYHSPPPHPLAPTPPPSPHPRKEARSRKCFGAGIVAGASAPAKQIGTECL